METVIPRIGSVSSCSGLGSARGAIDGCEDAAQRIVAAAAASSGVLAPAGMADNACTSCWLAGSLGVGREEGKDWTFEGVMPTPGEKSEERVSLSPGPGEARPGLEPGLPEVKAWTWGGSGMRIVLLSCEDAEPRLARRWLKPVMELDVGAEEDGCGARATGDTVPAVLAPAASRLGCGVMNSLAASVGSECTDDGAELGPPRDEAEPEPASLVETEVPPVLVLLTLVGFLWPEMASSRSGRRGGNGNESGAASRPIPGVSPLTGAGSSPGDAGVEAAGARGAEGIRCGFQRPAA